MSWFKKQAPESAEDVKDAAIKDGKHFAGVVSNEAGKTIDAAKHDLSRVGRNAQQSAQQTADQASNSAQETADQARGWLGGVKQKAESHRHAMEDAGQDYIQRGKDQANQLGQQANQFGQQVSNDAKETEGGIRSWFGGKKREAEQTLNNAQNTMQQYGDDAQKRYDHAASEAKKYARDNDNGRIDAVHTYSDRSSTSSSAQRAADDAKFQYDSAANKASNAAQDASNKVSNAADDASNKVSGWLSSAKKEVNKDVNYVKNEADRLAHRGESKLNEAESKASSWLGGAKRDVQQASNDAENKASSWLGGAKRDVQEATNDAENKANSWMSGAQRDVQGAKNDASGWLSGAKRDVQGAKNDAENKASGWFSGVKRDVQNAKNDVNDAVDQQHGQQYGHGPNFIQSIDRTAEHYNLDATSASSDNIIPPEFRRGNGKFSAEVGRGFNEAENDVRRGADNMKHEAEKAKSGLMGWFSGAKKDVHDAVDQQQGQYGNQAQQYGQQAQQYGEDAKRKAGQYERQAENKLNDWSKKIDKKASELGLDPRAASSDNILPTEYSDSTASDVSRNAQRSVNDGVDRAKRGMNNLGNDMNNAADTVKDKAEEAKSGVMGWFSGVKHDAKEKLHEVEDKASQYGNDAKHQYNDTKRESKGLLESAADKVLYAKDRAVAEGQYQSNKAMNEAQYAYKKFEAGRKHGDASDAVDDAADRAKGYGRQAAERVQHAFDDNPEESVKQKGRSIWDVITGKTEDAKQQTKRQVKQASRSAQDSADSLQSHFNAGVNKLENKFNRASDELAEKTRWMKQKIVGSPDIARNDAFRVPHHDMIGTQYDALFRFYPTVAHNLVINTPDILPQTATARIGNWKVNPALSWQVVARDPQAAVQAVTTRFNARAVETNRTGAVKNDAFLTSALYMPTTNYMTASYLTASGTVNNQMNGSAIGFKSYIDPGKAIATTRARFGSRGPAVSVSADIDSKTMDYKMALGLSQTLFRDISTASDVSVGVHAVSTQMTDMLKPKSGQYTVDHLVSRAEATVQYNQSNRVTADAKLSITPTPTNPKVGDFRVRAAYTDSIYKSASYPRYSIGVAAGAVAFNEGGIYDSDAAGYREESKLFNPQQTTKQLGIVDLLYQLTPYVRFGARFSSDKGAALHYQQNYAEGVMVKASIHNGNSGVYGDANKQSRGAPVLGVGITLGD